MKSTKPHTRLELLWFVLGAALIWLLMSTSRTKSSKTYTVYFESDTRYFPTHWLVDTVSSCRIEAKAEGIQVFFMDQLSGTHQKFNADTWMRHRKNQHYISASDRIQILKEHYGDQYDFSILGSDTLEFTSANYDTLALAIHLDPLQWPRLSSDFRWISPPTPQTDSILVFGPQDELNTLGQNLVISLNNIPWDGEKRYNLSVQGLPPHCTPIPAELTFTGTSDRWTDSKLFIPHSSGAVEVWISGPVSLLQQQSEITTYLNLQTTASPSGERIRVQSTHKSLEVLNWRPKTIR